MHPMRVELQPVRIALPEEGGGRLVFIDEWLVAVLVRLSADHGPLAGHWYLETGYGRFGEGQAVTFSDETSAIDWFKSTAADGRFYDLW